MAPYAKDTSVPASKTKAEIENTLTRFGASRFVYGWEDTRAVVGFTYEGFHVRLVLPFPDRKDRDIQYTPTGILRTALQIEDQYDKEVRRRWRAFGAVIKAKLVAVNDGITTVEREFFAGLVLPNGETMEEWTATQFDSGGMPALLPGPS